MKEWYHISELEKRSREDFDSMFNKCLGGPWAIHQMFVDQKIIKERRLADGRDPVTGRDIATGDYPTIVTPGSSETHKTPETCGETSTGVNMLGFLGFVVVAAGAAAWYLGSKNPAKDAPKGDLTDETAI